jgi:predicted O-methyltransferase YrrM
MSVVSAHDMPWMAREVIDWLDMILKPNMSVLETGAGGSTIFFGRRARNVLSFEHEKSWRDKIQGELRRLALPGVVIWSPSYPQDGLELSDRGTFDMARGTFDMALIDGRGRVLSVIDALPALKPGGWLVLDDSDRPRYAPAHAAANAVCPVRIVFRSDEDETTAWRKA